MNLPPPFKLDLIMTHVSPNGAIPNSTLLFLMSNESIGTQYEPIVDIESGEIFAWEALARFVGSDGKLIPPNLVFEALHFSPLSLFQMELRIKQFQLAHAPDSGKLFINIDQDAFDVFENDQTNPLVTIVAKNDRIVVEIIENSSISDARISASMGNIYTNLGVPLALDDIGAHHSMVDLNLLPKVSYLKLSLDWISRIAEKDALILLNTIIEYSRKAGKKTILEGVETPEHLNMAKELGVNFVQGYHYQDLFYKKFQSHGPLTMTKAA